MGDTYSNLFAHIIFSTKDREAMIGAGMKERLYAYVGGIVREVGSTLIEMGGCPDHVHKLVRYPPRVAVAELMRLVKTNSSRWVHQDVGRGFGWQNAYSACAVSESVVPEVVAYIRNQEEHHRTMSFKEEYVKFLERNKVEYDERWVWE